MTETVSWGVLYYAFAVFLLPMQRELGFSAAQLTGAFSLALLVSGGRRASRVGRYLDRRSPRALMTAGSVAGAVLVVAWSRVHGLAAFYALWVAIGLVMATVLYEPAFTVVAKWFRDADARRRALTALTLVAALASFIFLPLSQALIDAHGWRDALVILAVILAVVTIPLHALVLRRARRRATREARRRPRCRRARRCGRAAFWLLSVAFFLATLTGDRHDGAGDPLPARARLHAPVRGLRGGPDRHLADPRPAAVRSARRAAAARICDRERVRAVACGHRLDRRGRRHAAVLVGFVVLGMGNGMTTLARATAMADSTASARTGRSAASPPS